MSHTPQFAQLIDMQHGIRALDAWRNALFVNPDKGTTRDEVAENLTQSLIKIHENNAQDSSQYQKKQGDIYFRAEDFKKDALEMEKLRAITHHFAVSCYNEAGECTIANRDQALKALEYLYEALEGINLNQAAQAAGLLISELGRSEKWKTFFPHGLNFTRADPEAQKLSDRFRVAAEDFTRPQPEGKFIIHSEAVALIGPEGHKLRFPSKKIDDWRTHIVTRGGYLVDLTDSLRTQLTEHIRQGKPLDTFEVPVNRSMTHLSEKVHPEEAPEGSPAFKRLDALRHELGKLRVSDTVDGRPHGEKQQDGHVVKTQSLLCMDVDVLTGLRMDKSNGTPSELDQFKKFMEAFGKQAGLPADTMKMSDFLPLMPPDADIGNIAIRPQEEQAEPLQKLERGLRQRFAQMKEFATAHQPEMVDVVSRVEERMVRIMPRVWHGVDKAFIVPDNAQMSAHLKRPSNEKRFYQSQGGMGSGKTYAQKIARKECGENLVVASLDDVRGESEQFALYQATDNHNDDYKKFEEFGKLIRAMTLRRAIEGGYDTLLDGTGIPYQKRYDGIVQIFKDQHYHTSVLAADCALYVNQPSMRQELMRDKKMFGDALGRQGMRLRDSGRTITLDLVSDSHMRAPNAMMNAARDPNVDRFLMQDTNPSVEDAYTLSFVVRVTEDELRQFQGKSGRELREQLQAVAAQNEGVRKILADVQMPRAIEAAPKGTGSRTDPDKGWDFQIVRDNLDGTYLMQVITDMPRYLATVQKGLFNRDVVTKLKAMSNGNGNGNGGKPSEIVGPEHYTENTLLFDVRGRLQNEEGRLKTAPDLYVQIEPWPVYPQATVTKTPHIY